MKLVDRTNQNVNHSFILPSHFTLFFFVTSPLRSVSFLVLCALLLEALARRGGEGYGPYKQIHMHINAASENIHVTL
jgi:hypothetical protein